MSERLEALKSKLPLEVLSLIRSYDSHLLSDLIREIEFEALLGHVYAASGLRLKNCLVWRPLANELRRRPKGTLRLRDGSSRRRRGSTGMSSKL